MLCAYYFSSNCVVNLSPDKKAVISEAYKVLKVSQSPAFLENLYYLNKSPKLWAPIMLAVRTNKKIAVFPIP